MQPNTYYLAKPDVPDAYKTRERGGRGSKVNKEGETFKAYSRGLFPKEGKRSLAQGIVKRGKKGLAKRILKH